jgi:two-component system nitrogen regulation sensor histidine kinase GlnL
MSEIYFVVDENLCITDCCDRLAEVRSYSDENVRGLPYTRLLPQLRHQDCDALAWVLQNGQKLLLEKIDLGERFSPDITDLVIEPLGEEKSPDGLRITLRIRQDGSDPVETQAFRRSEELEKLAIMLSHGVRNPLNAIKGAVTYLQNRFAHEAELNEFTGIMTEEIDRLERFISGFLTTSSLDQAIPLDINALLKKISVYNSLQARAANVELILDCGPVRPLTVVPFQVEQAILNLLNNAIAVLPPGGRVFLRSGLCCRAGCEFVSLEVADNGPGMPPDRIAVLEDPESSPERGRERGFGLFITREVVQSHGGIMEIESEAGKGTLVRLLFPVTGGGFS